jgi:CRP/FNR family cyclic AMP-dependent transcriptional regulator
MKRLIVASSKKPEHHTPSLALRASLMDRFGAFAAASGLTQVELAARLGLTQPRLNALLRKRIEQFSLDALVNVAARAGMNVALYADPPLAEPETRDARVDAAELASIPLFASLTASDLQTAARCFEIRTFPKGALIASEGDHLDKFNIILSGRVEYFSRDETGHEFRTGVDGPGAHFVDATLGGEPILMSLVALEALRVASVPMSELERLLLRYPSLAVALLLGVVKRLRRSVERARSLGMEDVYGRVVRLLHARAGASGGRLVTERITHAYIADRVGASREMVGRILRDLARGGYVASNRGRIEILRTPPRRW